MQCRRSNDRGWAEKHLDGTPAADATRDADRPTCAEVEAERELGQGEARVLRRDHDGVKSGELVPCSDAVTMHADDETIGDPLQASSHGTAGPDHVGRREVYRRTELVEVAARAEGGALS